MRRGEFIKAMQQECPSMYINLAQRHLEWLRECDTARSCLRAASEVLEENPMDDRALYAFPQVRMARGELTDTQKQLFDQGHFIRLIFQPRVVGKKQNRSTSRASGRSSKTESANSL